MRTERALGLASGLLPLLLLASAGCPGTLPDRERFLVDGKFVSGDLATPALDDGGADAGGTGPCGDVPTRVFIPSCGGSGCHGKTAPQQGLDLESAGVATRLLGKSGMECPAVLADPANPEGSLIYTKLLPSPSCGAQMPFARPPLPAADIACVKAWIAAQ